MTNVFFLTNNIDDIKSLISLFKEMHIINLNELIENNPFILNLNVFDIQNYISICKNNGESSEKIVQDFIDNPYIINEMI